MGHDVDVVIVGGGIAGCALARALALGGLSALVLEREAVYRDKVRGEFLQMWGAQEATKLGIEDVLRSAGGHPLQRVVPYDEVLTPQAAELRAPGAAKLWANKPGPLGIGHPQACEALARAAEEAGARVLRGVQQVRVRALGGTPELSYVHAGDEHHVRTRLIVGADGRQSGTRKQLGMSLDETTPRTLAAGLLVRGFEAHPADHASVGSTADSYYLVFPRAGGVARLYILWSIAQRQRFAGPDGAQRFLAAYGNYKFPYATQVGRAEATGPCATFPMNDSLVDQPVTDGALLIGDAAGWNDPIIGQGLSIALRDARMVSEILLDGASHVSPIKFAPYVIERRERMRRLRIAASIATDMRCTFTPFGRARRQAWYENATKEPWSAATALCSIVGPEAVPAEGFEPQAIERILAMS